MWKVRDILTFIFFRQDLRDCQDVFPVFYLDRDRVGNWLRVTAFVGLLGFVGLRVFRVAGYGLRVTGYGLRVPRLIIFLSLQDISSTLRQSPVWIFFHQ